MICKRWRKGSRQSPSFRHLAESAFLPRTPRPRLNKNLKIGKRMNETHFVSTSAVLARWEPESDAVYPIDDVARFVGRSRRYVALCIRYGLITPAIDSNAEGWFFSAEA